MSSNWATVGQGSTSTMLPVGLLRYAPAKREQLGRQESTARARVGVRMMECIERPPRLHRDREHPIVRPPHLDPQPPRSLPPEQPHPRSVRRALSQLTHAHANRRYHSLALPVELVGWSLVMSRLPSHSSLQRTDLVSAPRIQPFPAAASPTTREKTREIDRQPRKLTRTKLVFRCAEERPACGPAHLGRRTHYWPPRRRYRPRGNVISSGATSGRPLLDLACACSARASSGRAAPRCTAGWTMPHALEDCHMPASASTFRRRQS